MRVIYLSIKRLCSNLPYYMMAIIAICGFAILFYRIFFIGFHNNSDIIVPLSIIFYSILIMILCDKYTSEKSKERAMLLLLCGIIVTGAMTILIIPAN